MSWQLIGNGHACALPYGERDRARAEGRQLIFVGVSSAQLARDLGAAWDEIGLSWGELSGVIDIAAGVVARGALIVVRPTPDGSGVDAALYAPPELTHLLSRVTPFSSRGGLPDIVVFNEETARLFGYYGMDWAWREDWTLYIP